MYVCRSRRRALNLAPKAFLNCNVTLISYWLREIIRYLLNKLQEAGSFYTLIAVSWFCPEILFTISEMYRLVQTDMNETFKLAVQEKIKVKFPPVHPMKTRRGSTAICLLIFNLGIRWYLMPWPIYLRERNFLPIQEEAGWSFEPFSTFRKENFCPPRIRTPHHPVPNLVAVPTTLCRLITLAVRPVI